MSDSPQRGPIPAIILASSQEDIRKCGHCEPCCVSTVPEMDVTLGEMLQMASRNDPSIFSTRTLWTCDAVVKQYERCQEGIDLARVIEALRNEARLRGFSEVQIEDPQHTDT